LAASALDGSTDAPVDAAPAPIATSAGATALLAGASDPRPPDGIPRAIRRIARDQRGELDAMLVLARSLTDERGRARAVGETTPLLAELTRIEAGLPGADSARLDVSVTDLLTLDRKIEVLHDSLRIAAPGLGEPQAAAPRAAP